MKPSIEVIVVSDRVHEGQMEDVSGKTAKKMIEDRGLSVDAIHVIPNSYRELIRILRESKSRVLIFIGGTGPGPRDLTVDVVSSLAWRHIPGFGELFRTKSFEVKGYRGILSRSELFILHDGKVVACLPGSPEAVELGVNILLSIIQHLLEEVDRYEGSHG
ncbi:MAG: molybdopterin-binding protein [Thermosphaera sp.]